MDSFQDWSKFVWSAKYWWPTGLFMAYSVLGLVLSNWMLRLTKKEIKEEFGEQIYQEVERHFKLLREQQK